MAEVDPCPSAHGLVDPETGGSTLVVYGVEGVVRAVGECLVGDVNGIAAAFRYL